MCLTVNKEAEKKFRERHKGKKRIVVWKVIRKNNTTIYQDTLVNAGWFKAIGLIDRESYLSFDLEGDIFVNNIYGGVIHVCVNRKEARNIQEGCGNRRIIRCEALVKDLVAVGKSGDACFTKIWIPKKQLKRT